MQTYILVVKTEGNRNIDKFLESLPGIFEESYLTDTEAHFVEAGILAGEDVIALFTETLESDAHASNFDPELRQRLLDALHTCEVAYGSVPSE